MPTTDIAWCVSRDCPHLWECWRHVEQAPNHYVGNLSQMDLYADKAFNCEEWRDTR